MSYDVANGTPFGANSLLEDNWHKSPDDRDGGDLQAIVDFNVEFDANNGNATINPQLAFGSNQYDNPFNDLDQTLSPEPSTFGAQASEFTSQPTSSPYFSSVESTAVPTFHQPPHMRNQQFHHRRSVSEPPSGPPASVPQIQQQQRKPQGPAMMFHRDNHFLGKPLSQKPVPLKSQYKSRPQRQYAQARRQKMEPYPGPELRRTQTQPMRHMATMSVPVHHVPPQYYQQPHPQPHQQVQMVAQGPRYVSSRICTPTPETGNTSTPPQSIDPTLATPLTPAGIPEKTMPQQTNVQNETVSIPLTVDELRKMIFDAVQKAVHGEATCTPAAMDDTGAPNYELTQVGDPKDVVEQEQVARAPLDFETTL